MAGLIGHGALNLLLEQALREGVDVSRPLLAPSIMLKTSFSTN